MFIYGSDLCSTLCAYEEELGREKLEILRYRLVGRVDDDDIDAAWELLRPGDLSCIECTKPIDIGDDSACTACAEVKNGGRGYDLPTVLNFLRDNFREELRHYAYLAIEADDGEIHSLGTGVPGAQMLPFSYCYKEEFARKTVLTLLPHIAYDPRLLEKLGTVQNKKGIHHVLRYLLPKEGFPMFIPVTNNPSGDGYARISFCKKEDLKLDKAQDFLQDLINAYT